MGGKRTYLEHENATSRRIFHTQKLKNQRTRDLVGGIANAHIMRREVQLDGIAQQDLELLGERRAHDTLGDLAGHARVQLDGNQLLGFFEDAHADVARARADFEDGVCWLEEGLVDDGVRYSGVLEDVLADIGVEFEDVVLAGGRRGGGF